MIVGSTDTTNEPPLFSDAVQPRGQARMIVFTVRLSHSEYRLLRRTAGDEGRTVANFIRARWREVLLPVPVKKKAKGKK